MHFRGFQDEFYESHTYWAEWEAGYLSNERCIVAVSEENGKNALRELFDFMNYEALSAFCPTNNIGILVVLNESRCTSRIS